MNKEPIKLRKRPNATGTVSLYLESILTANEPTNG